MRLSYAQRAATTSTTTTTTWRKVSSTRRLIYGFVLIVVPWLRERLRAALEAIGGPATRGTERKVLQCVRWCEAGLGMASLINFALFLQTGSFPSLTERLLAITAVYPHRQHIRQVSYDYLTRELLWHGLSVSQLLYSASHPD
ncbi:peroxisome biogenesis factor 2-like [Argonauta hians]